MIEKLGTTPGPWINNDYYKCIHTHNTEVELKPICRYGRGTEGDYNLIAAAPEMLEWMIDNAYEIRSWLHPKSDIVRIIEKATGHTWAEIKELME